jgi:hypothetical protein
MLVSRLQDGIEFLAVSNGVHCMSALVIAKAALRRSPLKVHKRGWHFKGNRYFSFKTVKTLMDAGEAVRVGNMVKAVSRENSSCNPA